MKRLRRPESGFSVLAVLFILVLLIGIGGVGYVVYKTNQKSRQQTVQPTPPPPPSVTNDFPDSEEPPLKTKTYAEALYGLTFDYPEDWKLEERFEDRGNAQPEGDVWVTTPAGGVVKFRLNVGSKDQECLKAPVDRAHRTVDCNTIEYLTQQQLTIDPRLALVKTKWTLAGPDGKTEYGLFVKPYDRDLKLKSPKFDSDYAHLSIMEVRTGFIESLTEAPGVSSEAFFQSQAAKEIARILKTVKIPALK